MKKSFFAALLALPLLVGSCSKDDSDDASPSTGPKEYQVEYRVTASQATTAQIIYRDATGTEVVDQVAALPKTYSFKRTMKQADVVSCGAFLSSAPASATVTSTLLVDGKEVKKETGSGANAQAIAIYLIP